MKYNKKYEELKGVELFVGIDIGKDTHFVSLMKKDGELILSGLKVSNNLKGFDTLLNELNISNAKIAIAMEPTGHYWKALAYFLKERNYRIFLINPFHVKLSKELMDNRQRKTDKKDSLLICNLLREGKYLNNVSSEVII